MTDTAKRFLEEAASNQFQILSSLNRAMIDFIEALYWAVELEMIDPDQYFERLAGHFAEYRRIARQ